MDGPLAHERNLKIVLDFVPNHSSEEHEWFKKSVAKEDPYTDFYVWADPKGFDENENPIAPSNWVRKTIIFFRAHKLKKENPNIKKSEFS